MVGEGVTTVVHALETESDNKLAVTTPLTDICSGNPDIPLAYCVLALFTPQIREAEQPGNH